MLMTSPAQRTPVTDLLPPDLAMPDRLALSLFLIAWLGYGRLIHSRLAAPNITSRMNRVRVSWMHAMLGRDNRVTDASLLGNTMHSGTFFASTTMIALAALLGLLGRLDVAYGAVEELSFTAKTSRPLVEFKILLLLAVFGHTFLKLTWALRQLNYCIALIGGAPLKPSAGQRDVLAERIAAVLSLAISSFNAGIRGYYFALAGLAWFLGAGAFLLVTTGILAMLLWRQFASATSDAIRMSEQEFDRLPVQTHRNPPSTGNIAPVT